MSVVELKIPKLPGSMKPLSKGNHNYCFGHIFTEDYCNQFSKTRDSFVNVITHDKSSKEIKHNASRLYFEQWYTLATFLEAYQYKYQMKYILSFTWDTVTSHSMRFETIMTAYSYAITTFNYSMELENPFELLTDAENVLIQVCLPQIRASTAFTDNNNNNNNIELTEDGCLLYIIIVQCLKQAFQLKENPQLAKRVYYKANYLCMKLARNYQLTTTNDKDTFSLIKWYAFAVHCINYSEENMKKNSNYSKIHASATLALKKHIPEFFGWVTEKLQEIQGKTQGLKLLDKNNITISDSSEDEIIEFVIEDNGDDVCLLETPTITTLMYQFSEYDTIRHRLKENLLKQEVKE